MEDKRLRNRYEIMNTERLIRLRFRAYMATTSKEEAASIMAKIKADNERLTDLYEERRKLTRKNRFKLFNRTKVS